MASGQQLAEQNVLLFNAWVESKTDEDFRTMVSRSVLSRKVIAEECAFAVSVLNQNPRIKKSLHELEASLRSRGVLPALVQHRPDIPFMDKQPHIPVSREADRVRRLEQENASMKAEIAELKLALDKYSLLRDALALTGRLPR
jgi:hypothetical protein